jgi:hypothetical protein
VVLDKIAEIDAQGRQPVRRNGIAQDFSGKIPSFNLGKNRVQLLIAQAGDSIITQPTYNSNNQTTLHNLSGQSIIPPSNGTITKVSFPFMVNDPSSPSATADFYAILYNNNAGVPGSTVLGGGLFNVVKDGVTRWIEVSFTVPVSVASGTTYWLVLIHQLAETMPGLPPSIEVRWNYNSTSVVTGNRARRHYLTEVWTVESNQDHAYTYTLAPTPSTNIDLNISYTPLYS